MSYSFSVRASSKDEAGVKVEAELAKVMLAQPVHERDRQAAQDAAEAFINILSEPGAGECISLSINGSLSWRGVGDFSGSSFSVQTAILKA